MDPEAQGRGLGSRLLTHVMGQHNSLDLTVYRTNTAAIAFYTRHGFRIVSEQTDPHTGQTEQVMTWHRSPEPGSTPQQHPLPSSS